MKKMVIPLLFTPLFGCGFGESDLTSSQFDRDFFHQSTDAQAKAFREYDLRTQFELLIVGNQIVHPPAMYLVTEFAKQGSAAIPFLRDRLASTKKEVTVRDVVAILAEMHRLRSYEASNDASLMELVEVRVSGMQGQWKDITQSMVEEIRKKS